MERAVQLVYTRILGYFDGMTFYSLDELNETIAQRVDDINMNMPRPDGLTRRELFDADEAPMMRDLPDTPFTEVSWRAVKVDRNWHICCDYQYYSVPFQYIGKTLRARLTNSLVSIFDGDELVAEHSRMHGFKYRYCTDPAHTPDKDIAGIKPLTRNELLARASSFGLKNHQGCLINLGPQRQSHTPRATHCPQRTRQAGKQAQQDHARACLPASHRP